MVARVRDSEKFEKYVAAWTIIVSAPPSFFENAQGILWSSLHVILVIRPMLSNHKGMFSGVVRQCFFVLAFSRR